LLLFAALFVRGEGLDLRHVALPTTVERHGNGLLGAMSWLEAEGIRTVSVRERFDTLAKRRDLPGAGNLLIVTLPVATPLGVPKCAPWISGSGRQYTAGVGGSVGPARLGRGRTGRPQRPAAAHRPRLRDG